MARSGFLAFILAFLLSTPASAASISFFGGGGGSGNGNASTLVDDVGCAADEYLRRNAGDTAWECSAAVGAGDSVTVDGVAVADPDFDDGGDIGFTDTANVVTATIKDDVVTAADMADGDHGDIAWNTNVATVQDLQCTDCIGATEISDVYLLNSGDAGTGTFDFNTATLIVPLSSSCTTATTLGQLCFDSDDFDLYIGNGTTADQMNGGAGGGAPTDATYLVTTADGTLSNEVAVGATPGGELEGTWAAPTLDDGVSVATWTITASTLVSPVVTTNIDLGSAGVRVSDDADGAITFLGMGNGSDEDFSINLDDTSNEVTFSSSTSVDTFNFIDNSIPLADLKVSDDQFLNLGSINNSDGAEGLVVPQATNCSAGTTEGQLCWDTDDNVLVMGDAGASTVTISGGGSGDITTVGNCTTGSCFQSTAPTGTTLYTDTDFIVELDQDTGGSNSFVVRDSADATAFSVTEAGLVTSTTLSVPSITNVTSVDATTEGTIETAVDTLSNLSSVGTITSGTWNVAAGTVTAATGAFTNLNGVTTPDATTENAIEGTIFDADAETVSGVWTYSAAPVIQDDVLFAFGTSSEWLVEYDDATDDQLLIKSTKTAAIATTDPMVEILVDSGTASGTNMTADQQVFGVAKGTQASNVALLTLNEDGDLTVAGTIQAAPTATPAAEFRDSDATDGDINARIFADCTDTGSGTEDCDLTIAQQEGGAEKNILVADADDELTLGSATTDSIVLSTDGTGTGEVVLPNDSISTAEILDNTIDASNLSATVTLADGDVLNLGSVSVSTTNEGLVLPGHATDCSTAGTTEGQVCWEADDDSLYIGNGATVSVIGAGADVSSVGNCTSGDCFGGADGTILTSTTSETINLATANTFIFARNDSGTVTFTGADDAGTADTVYDTTGAGAITIGSADVTAITLTTDATGDGTDVVLPTGAISSAEILNDTIDFSDLLLGASPPALMAANDVYFYQNGIAFEGATGVGNTNEVMLTIAGDPGSDITVTIPLTTGTLITTGDSGTVTSAMIATEVRSMWFGAAGLSVDGTECATPAEVTINSGPKLYTIVCTDSDSSTIYGATTMPDSWDGGTVTFEHVYIQTAADTGVLNGDIAAQCRGNGEVPSSTYGTEVAIDDAAVVGSNSNDHTTSGAVTPEGTCTGGDTLYWRYQLDATGTTTAVATLHHLGFKMEYTSGVGD